MCLLINMCAAATMPGIQQISLCSELRMWQGQASHALWQAWALMEASQGDSSAVRYLFKRGLEAGPRSRYLYLAWAIWEEKQGKRAFARRLLERGHQLNRRDPAILQVFAGPLAPAAQLT